LELLTYCHDIKVLLGIAVMKDKIKTWRSNSLGWLIAVLSNDMATALDGRLKELDLRIAVWPTLVVLWQEDGLTQAELSARCLTANYTTTRVLDALEKKGLIERKPHPTSRRAHLVYLTELGQSLRMEGIARGKATNKEFMAGLSESEQETLLTLVNKLIDGRNVS
jgi:DNA-binding MarR family transcriptional regulator